MQMIWYDLHHIQFGFVIGLTFSLHRSEREANRTGKATAFSGPS